MIRNEADARDFVAARAKNTAAIGKLDRYEKLLSQENRQQNLVSESSLQQVWARHFADSAQLIDHVPRETRGPWLDLGSGAGLPGIVLAALLPDSPVILVESRKRRVEWLERVVSDLSLQNCEVRGEKVERLEPLEASVITARAFAPLPKLLNLSARFSTSDTIWVLPKGRSAAQEVAQLKPNLRKMFHVEQSASDPDAGIIVGKGKVVSKQ